MEAIVKTTREIINVNWEKNPNGEGGHYVDKNGFHRVHSIDELEFNTGDYRPDAFMSDEEMAYDIAKLILNRGMEKIEMMEIGDLVECSVNGAKMFVEKFKN